MPMNAKNWNMMDDASSLEVHRILGRITQKKKRSRWYVLTLEVVEGLEKEEDHFDDDEAALPTQVVYVAKNSNSTASPFDEFALHIHSIISVTGRSVDRLPSLEEDESISLRRTRFFLVDHVKWIQCPPNLRVISEVLQALRRNSDQAPNLSVLVPFHATPQSQKDLVKLLRADPSEVSLSQLQHSILQGLQGTAARLVSRQRRPRVARADRELLQRLSCDVEPLYVTLEAEPLAGAPRSFAQLHSARGPLTRAQYMQYKKEPQVQWLLQRLMDLLPTNDRGRLRILDIGGGRGDLAVQLALRLPQAHITVVDRNPLEACQEWAEQQGVRLSLRQADFMDYMNEVSGDERWDCVVAWHACGDLTDAALHYAQHAASAVILCPCCYNKSSSAGRFTPPYYRTLERELRLDELPRIQRLAETSQDSATSRRAAVWINGRRIAAMGPGWRTHLEEFSSEYSARNLVLIGRKEDEQQSIEGEVVL